MVRVRQHDRPAVVGRARDGDVGGDRGLDRQLEDALDVALVEPDRIVEMPEDSWAPLLLTVALGILFVALLLKLWLVIALGGLLVFTALLFWLWPRRRLLEREPAHG